MKKRKAKYRFGDVGLSKNVFSVTSLPTIQDSALLELCSVYTHCGYGCSQGYC